MKKLLLTILVLWLGEWQIFAQQGEKGNIPLKDLALPNAPAFVLMDASPTLIERPQATKAFAFSILNSVVESGGLPKNYALELTPFWMIKSNKMNALRYWGLVRNKDQQNKNNVFAHIKQSTFSFAWVSQGDVAKNNFKQLISWGFRVPLVQVRKKEQRDSLWNAYNAIRLYLGSQNEVLANITGKYFQKLIVGDSTEFNREIDSYLKTLKIPEYLSNNIQHLLNRKPVFALDFAFAHNITFDNPSFSSNRLGRAGAWLTATYSNELNKKQSPNYLNIYVIGRYLLDNNTLAKDGALSERHNIDFGTKVELALENVSFGIEIINRNQVEDPANNSNRVAGILQYKINDNIALSGSFGQNFGKDNNLISFIGLHWGISKNEAVVVKK